MRTNYIIGNIIHRCFRYFLISFLLILNINSSLSFAQVNPVLSETLQKTLDSLKIRYKHIGISAAVVMPDKSEWTGASGMSDPDTQTALSSDMLFGMGSNTKTFISAIILQLASENKLSLEDSLHKWLPKYQNIDSTVTIRQLLNHTSGIYNYTNNDQFWNATNADLTKKFSPEEILTFVSTRSFAAGTNWEYSNTNYILLGMIIKKVTGSELTNELHRRLLIPFNLNKTFLEVEDTLRGELADCWTQLDMDSELENFSEYPRMAVYSGAWSAGAMVSTSLDLARWGRYLYGGEVLEAEYLNQMLDFTHTFGSNYGFGVFRTNILNREIWGHTGGIPGYISLMGYSKKDNVCLAVMFNQDDKAQDLVVFFSGLLGKVINYISTDIEQSENYQPVEFKLDQNYPNPFNPLTVIGYRLSVISNVELKVYDIMGREIETLVNKEQAPGLYKIEFDGSKFCSGTYFYRINITSTDTQGTNYTEIKKMTLIK